MGDEEEGNAVNLPLGMVAGRLGMVLIRLLSGNWSSIVSIVLRMNCERVIRWEDDMSTMCRSVFRRKIEYAIACATSNVSQKSLKPDLDLSFRFQDYTHTISYRELQEYGRVAVILP